MINRVQIQLALSKNSRSSSSGSGVVLRHSKPYAVGRAPRILSYAGLRKTPNHSAPSASPPFLTACSLHVALHSPFKTHSTRTLQRFSPIHFKLTGVAPITFSLCLRL